MLNLKLQSFGHLMKNWLTGKDPDAGKDWRWEKGMTEAEIVGWHHRLDGREFQQALGVGDGQGSLVCCSPWSRKELDTIEWLNWTNWRMCVSRHGDCHPTVIRKTSHHGSSPSVSLLQLKVTMWQMRSMRCNFSVILPRVFSEKVSVSWLKRGGSAATCFTGSAGVWLQRGCWRPYMVGLCWEHHVAALSVLDHPS